MKSDRVNVRGSAIVQNPLFFKAKHNKSKMAYVTIRVTLFVSEMSIQWSLHKIMFIQKFSEIKTVCYRSNFLSIQMTCLYLSACTFFIVYRNTFNSTLRETSTSFRLWWGQIQCISCMKTGWEHLQTSVNELIFTKPLPYFRANKRMR